MDTTICVALKNVCWCAAVLAKENMFAIEYPHCNILSRLRFDKTEARFSLSVYGAQVNPDQRSMFYDANDFCHE
jgi:hypothetical protein